MKKYVIERNIPDIEEHAKLSGFPANVITQITTVIDPTTANQ